MPTWEPVLPLQFPFRDSMTVAFPSVSRFWFHRFLHWVLASCQVVLPSVARFWFHQFPAICLNFLVFQVFLFYFIYVLFFIYFYLFLFFIYLPVPYSSISRQRQSPPPPTPLIPQMKVDFVWMWIPHMGNARHLRYSRRASLHGARRGRDGISFSILSMRESKAGSVVVCLHAGGRKHFRLGDRCHLICWPLLPTFLGGLRPNKGRTSPWQMPAGQAGAANISCSASARRRWCCCAHWGFQNSTSLLPSCGKSLFWMCKRSVALVTSINMAGGAFKCGVGSLVHRREFDRSHSDAAVLCAGVSFSWARPKQQPNESWVSRRIW